MPVAVLINRGGGAVAADQGIADKVKAALPGRTLEANLLDVALAMGEATTQPAAAISVTFAAFSLRKRLASR